MKKLMLATALACVLSATAMAGEIPTAGAPVPPPPSNSAAETMPGEIPSTGVPVPASSSNLLVVDAIVALVSIVV